MSLPPNWTRHVTDDGKEYFHNTSTQVTQWDRPQGGSSHDLGLAGLFDSAPSDVFQYKPTAAELEQSPLTAASGSSHLGPQKSQGLFDLTSDGFGQAGGEQELVSMRAPTGHIGEPARSSPINVPSGGLGGFAAGFAAGVAATAVRGADGAESGGLQVWLLALVQSLFDVSTQDVVSRLKLVLVPYPRPPQNSETAEELKARPDFYGPFWVATTAVLFLAATANFARLLESADHKIFKADYGLVGVAASVIYGGLLAVPLLLRAAFFFSGEVVEGFDFRQVVCVCGYALAPSIPVSILCVLPLHGFRSLAVCLGLGLSLLFLYDHMMRDIISKLTLQSWMKGALLAVPVLAQVLVFGVYRFKFFSHPA